MITVVIKAIAILGVVKKKKEVGVIQRKPRKMMKDGWDALPSLNVEKHGNALTHVIQRTTLETKTYCGQKLFVEENFLIS